MWSPLVLCLCVGFVLSAENPAWDHQHNYVYEVRARSLASLNQISNDYSGIIIKAQLSVQPKSDGKLGAKIFQAQYAKVHTELLEGWETYIPDSQLTYQDLPLSDKPFEIIFKNGVIRNILVSKQIKNWEANMIKSIVSQFQLDTKAENLIPSAINLLSQDESNSAVFKTMEESVTGVSETLYEIRPYPEYVLQSRPWLVPHKQLIHDGEVIEIQKNKNFTHSVQAPSFHAGLEGIPGYKPGNKIGNFVTRSSVSHAIITGSLKKYTIQSCVTVEDIALSPTLADHQKGSLRSKLNITLSKVAQPLEQSQYEIENPVEVGVVYRYDKPYSTDNSPRPAKEYDHGVAPSSEESQDSNRSPLRMIRVRDEPYGYPEQYWYQEKPEMSQAPETPLIPFNVGYDGQSIKKTQNIMETVKTLAEQIGQEFRNAKETLHQHTAGKFITLVHLIRILDQNEIQQIASQLYSEEAPAWIAFRDAVAQAGTGPALYHIKMWIKSRKLSHYQAAQIIATTAKNTRQPTEDYMKFFNEMVQDEDLMAKPYLNESLLLSYTNLVRQVYGNKQESHGKFPVYSFGSFRTERGLQYVKKNIIPYLTGKLNEAINTADNQKAHIYIRALGNVAQQEILEAFEPYLEGQRKASHFQRFLMVTALDQLVKSDPRVARSVLFKIYQNPTEYEPIRVVAVYILFATEPSPAMLQRMAAYTNVDTSKYVNAAVKSAIEQSSQSILPDFRQLRLAAQSAKPLLTNKQYGVQYSQNYLRSYMDKEINYYYYLLGHTVGGADHGVPKGFQYELPETLGGLKRYLIQVQAMVSSFEDLINVLEQQTEEYQRVKKEKQAQYTTKYRWTSESVAKLLGLENEQREQLEGYLYMHLGAFQHILSFDNHTLEQLPYVVKKWEEDLKKGQVYKFNKMCMDKEYAFAFPTVLGLPFLYTHHNPILIKSEADLKLAAKPEISNGKLFKKPNVVDAEFKLKAVVTGRVSAQLGIFTPFDHQSYTAGYTKNFQVVVPLTGELALNVQKQEIKLKLQVPENESSLQLGHYSSWPYTAQNDIYTTKPNVKIIRKEHQYKKNVVVGDKATGVAFYWSSSSDCKMDLVSLYEKLSQRDFLGVLLAPWSDKIQYVHIDVGIDAQKTSTQHAILRLSYQTDYQQNEPKRRSDKPVSDIPRFPEDPEQRQKEFIKRLGAYISNAQVLVSDATVDFVGQNAIKYSITAGASKSNVDPLGRFMALVVKHEKGAPQTVGYIQGVAHIPTTNGLNMDYAMEMKLVPTFTIQGLLRHEQRLSQLDAHVELSKSEKRVEYLKQSHLYKECKKEMEKGNTQLPICARLTVEANLLDKFDIKIKYNNLEPYLVNATYKAYSILRHHLYPRVDEDIIEVQPSNRFEILGQFNPELHALNATIVSEYGKSELKNVQLNRWARQLLVPHPVFHLKSRLVGELLKEETLRPICVLDKTDTNTFDNKTYPTTLTNSWTVLLQYVPRRPSSVANKPVETVPEQLHQAVESYVVYGRAAHHGTFEKEIKLVLQMPATKGKIAKIVLKKWKEDKAPKVFVNEIEAKYTLEKSADFYDGHVQIYALPNQEVKVEIHGAFYAIFNGQTLKLTAVNSKFRDSIRGLCGTFTGEPETDFAAPDNCILQKPEHFVESYTIDHSGRIHFPRRKAGEECLQKKLVPVNYISNQDAGRSSEYDKRTGDECTGHLTRYVERNGNICFTIRALPFCKSGCKPLTLGDRPIDVHCMEPTANTAFWRAKIDKKINQDFTMLQPTEKITMKVPARCVP